MEYMMKARKFKSGQFYSLGKAAYMIIRQHNFPYSYEPDESFETQDSDHVILRNFDQSRKCIAKHTKHVSEYSLDVWFEKASDSQIMEFIKEFIEADPKVNWTGYRVLGSVHQGDGWNIWTLQLFAKSPASKTEVYSGKVAPNVEV
jgi:hypothetical protein